MIDNIHPLQKKMEISDVFPFLMSVKEAMGWNSFNALEKELLDEHKLKHDKKHQQKPSHKDTSAEKKKKINVSPISAAKPKNNQIFDLHKNSKS